jgi:hypothetical protein
MHTDFTNQPPRCSGALASLRRGPVAHVTGHTPSPAQLAGGSK